ncbi:hypothetical protein QF044_000349 [Chryseobacterium sp. W4I1]|nr:hypothetical protein [Chryseobacterium sp. W4I1]
MHQHPDRPFVMGGMFHGGIGGGGGTDNNIKSLSSRSGNKLELNDGEGSVFLTDQGGANMKFDGAGNAQTNANNNKTVNVGNNNTVNAGSTSAINVGGKEGEGANAFLKMDAAGNISLEGKTKIELKVGENTITITKEGISVSAKEGMLDMNSLQNALLVTQDNLSIHSQSKTSINATGDLFITGSIVDIN